MSKTPDACRNVHSISFFFIDEIKHLQFFLIHTTFQYLRSGKGKRFELYLSLTDFQFPDLLFFFTGEFLSFARSPSNSLVLKADPPETEDSPSDFSNVCRPFGAKILSTNHSTSLLSPSRRIRPLD